MNKRLNFTVLLWVIYIAAVCVFIAARGFPPTVTNAYMTGAMRWLHSECLYSGGRGFIYLPTAAIFYIPLAVIPFALSEIFIRIVFFGALALALFNFAKLVEKKDLAYLVMTIVTLPLAFSCARNGQFNTILLAMMLFAVAALVKQRWWWVTFFLMLGFALKPTMIVLFLLLWVLYRPLWCRIPIGLVVVILFPFLFQHPQYVIAQYQSSLAMIKTISGVGYNELDWAQIFGLLIQFGVMLSTKIQLLISVVAALGTLYLGFIIKKKFEPKKTAILLFSIAACYLLLFNPRTENNDYMILAPAIGMFLYWAWQQKRWFTVGILIFLVCALTFTYYISTVILPSNYFLAAAPIVSNSWCAPLMGLIFMVIVVTPIFTKSSE
jgi:hypothetical protein